MGKKESKLPCLFIPNLRKLQFVTRNKIHRCTWLIINNILNTFFWFSFFWGGGGVGGSEGEDREEWGQGRTGERVLEAEVTQFACTMSFILLIIRHIFHVFSIYFFLCS